MNAITLFVFSGLVGRLTLLIKVPGTDGKKIYLKTWLYEHLLVPLTHAPINASPYTTSLFWAIGFAATFLLIATWMYRRRIFLKV